MAEIIRLATNQVKPVRACATCRYFMPDDYPRVHALDYCGAVGDYVSAERPYGHICGPAGLMWEPNPPRVPGFIERAWRFIFGYRPA